MDAALFPCWRLPASIPCLSLTHPGYSDCFQLPKPLQARSPPSQPSRTEGAVITARKVRAAPSLIMEIALPLSQL